MKAILKMDEGSKVIVDLLSYPPRKERETWHEFEERIRLQIVKSQPRMVHKIIGIHILRH